MQGTDRGRFSHSTRIGNWYEEMVNEEEKMRQFLEKKEKGLLTIQRIRQNLVSVQMPPPSEDGYLHFDKLIRIANADLQCTVACDPNDAENVDEGMYSATGCRTPEITARNVWILQKVNNKNDELLKSEEYDNSNESIVRYGDQFYISTTEYLDSKPFYLSSHLLDWSHYSRVAHKQIVFSTQKYSYKCVWRIESLGDTMMEMEGEPVKIGDWIQLKHCSTGAPLAVHEGQHLNDYGSEYELIANKVQNKKMIWTFLEE